MYKNNKLDLAQNLIQLSNEKKCIVIVSHKQIKFINIDNVRRKAKEGTIIKKIKNKIANKAFINSNFSEATKELKGENFFIFSNDIFDACTTAQNLTKETSDITIIKAAFDEEKNLDMNIVNEFSQLGSKQSLQSKLLSVINEVVQQPLRVIQCKVDKES